MRYEMFDLVRERANEKDWVLIFDSGPNGDRRTMIWEHPLPSAAGLVMELEIVFSPDGRIVFSERRRDGVSHQCISFIDAFTATDAYIQVLQMI